jgi:hypothetical protein
MSNIEKPDCFIGLMGAIDSLVCDNLKCSEAKCHWYWVAVRQQVKPVEISDTGRGKMEGGRPR